MPHHLMNLRNVPDDEADDIRALFEEHDVHYYETPPSRWGISMGGFWVHADDEAARARSLLNDYQARRRESQRLEYQARCERGETGWWYQFRSRPVAFLAAVVAITVILGFTLLPFVRLG
ncbi:DUF6164 family protein [Marinobacter sp.]|uniref:DUF6164 family protein n=1 Tax=Marinobacter sp. TaxID=50741 RepID=UPI003562F852